MLYFRYEKIKTKEGKGRIMEHYARSIIPVIEYNYENFTALERTIADFFIQNKKKRDFSAKRSRSVCLYRRRHSPGLRRNVDSVVIGSLFINTKIRFGEKKSRPFADNTKRVLDTYQELLNKAYNLADEKKFQKIAGMLTRAEKIFVCGVGSSGIASRETELRFMRIGLNINSLVDRDMIRMRAVFQNAYSLVIGFSMKGETEEVQYMLREAKRRGAKCILVTARNNPDCLEYCDEIILVPALDNLEYGM